jgi:uncharacterized repeat protein (TIGR01451 family)
MKSGTDSSTDYMSMYVTGRNSSDAAGTMESSVLVPAGAGQANYKDFSSGGRAGDLSGINVDPSDGSFWAANEFANTEATANWGTAVANFTLSSPLPATDMAITATGPSSVDVTNGSTNATYTITITNNGPNAAQGVVLSDALPSGSTFVSMTPASTNPDSFTLAQSGGTVTETANANMASGSSDTFTLVVSAAGNLSNGTAFNDTASVSSSNPDSNTTNNNVTVSGTIVNNNPNADLAVSISGPTSASEGSSASYYITVTNTGPASATGVTLTDTLGSLFNYQSATTPTGTTFTVSGNVVTFSLGTIASGGQITVSVTAQAIEDGSTSDTASVSSSSPDPNTANNSASATTSLGEPPISVSAAITTRNRTFSGQTATFTHASGVEPASAFIATINWGDGTTSTGTITQLSNGSYSVTGTHTYAGGNKHKITTTVTEAGNAVSKLDVDPGSLPPSERDVVWLPQAITSGNSDPARSVLSSLATALASAVDFPGAQSSSQPAGNPLITTFLDVVEREVQLIDELFSLEIDFLRLFTQELSRSNIWSGGSAYPTL